MAGGLCCGIIFLYNVKACHSDWLNKKLNDQQLVRIFGVERMLGRRSVESWGVASQIRGNYMGSTE